MSDFFHPMTQQTSRKLRQCIACAYAIEKGEQYCKQSGVWEGEYATNEYHNACWDALISEGPQFEFTPGYGEPPEGARSWKEALSKAAPKGEESNHG